LALLGVEKDHTTNRSDWVMCELAKRWRALTLALLGVEKDHTTNRSAWVIHEGAEPEGCWLSRGLSRMGRRLQGRGEAMIGGRSRSGRHSSKFISTRTSSSIVR